MTQLEPARAWRNPPRVRTSKYMPHQGEREKMRRRIGGFHTILWHAKHSIPLSDRLTKELS